MLWKKNKEEKNAVSLSWDEAALQALEQAVSQAPVPSMLKNTMKSQLKTAAETEATKNGHTTVTPEDLIQGMLAKMPAEMKAKVETAMQKGPEGLKNLEEDLKNK